VGRGNTASNTASNTSSCQRKGGWGAAHSAESPAKLSKLSAASGGGGGTSMSIEAGQVCL